MNILQFTNSPEEFADRSVDYGSMVEQLNKTIAYLKTRYDVRLHYDHFKYPDRYGEQLLYKVSNNRKDIMWVYYINTGLHKYISVETEPEYLETRQPDVSVFDRNQIRKSHPCQKLFFHDYDQIKDSLAAICDSIDEYFSHDSTMKNNQITEWLVPCNPNLYDIDNAVLKTKEMYWRQNANYSVGDIMYIYVSRDVGEIRYKFEVEKLDIRIPKEMDQYWLDQEEASKNPIRNKLKLLNCFPNGSIRLNDLKAHGLLSRIQGPMKLRGDLKDYIKQCDDYYRVVSVPAGKTGDIIKSTHVHAHPNKKGYPKNPVKWLMARETGGVSDIIYEVTDTLLYNASSYPNDCDPRISDYIQKRNIGIGFTPETYKFYLLKPVYKFSNPFVLRPNLQGFTYFSLNDLMSRSDALKVTNGETVIHDINIPVAPADIQSDGNTVKVTCSTCEEIFIKAPRCPRCGQLQNYGGQ